MADQWEENWRRQAEVEEREWMHRQEMRRKNEAAWQAKREEFSETQNPEEEDADADAQTAARAISQLEAYTYF